MGLLVAGASWTGDDPRRQAWPLVAANLALITLATLLLLRAGSGTWFGFFFYAATTAALLRPDRRAIGLMVIAGVVAAASMAVSLGDVMSGLLQGVSVTVIGLVVHASFAVRRTNEQLVEARHQLATLAVAEERNRIARDLHDTLGHSLSLISVKGELAARLLPGDPERAREEVGDMTRVAREALAEVRDTVSGYRRPSLHDELVSARTALTAAGILAEIDPVPDGLPRLADALLAWTVREATTNIVRHSGAHSARIVLRREGDAASVDVTDDGRGPDQGPALGGGTGLAGLRDRLSAAGGRMEQGPAGSSGFRVHATVPITTMLAARP